MLNKSLAAAAALTFSVAFAGIASSETISIVNELGGTNSGLTGSLNVTETAGTPFNYYGVENNINGDLLAFGVTAINSTQAVLNDGAGDIGSFECDFPRGNNWCYEARVITALDWATATVLEGFGSPFGPTFQEAFGDVTNYLTGPENTLNWYTALDGNMLSGDTSDGFFGWESNELASSILGIGGTGTGTAAFTAGQATTPGISPVPLPAAGWMLIAGLGGLAAMGRRRKV